MSTPTARLLQVRRITVGALVALSAVGCTIQDTKTPPLQGPSELSLAFTLSAVPDVLTQDGASQAQIIVQARDANGQPARNVTFRVDTTVNGALADFGSLSARTLVTGNDGRATLTYTAPPSITGSVDIGQEVIIQVTPFGTDFSNTVSRTVRIRLIPPGVLLPGGPKPPASPALPFTITPSSPAAFTDVTFNASGWTAAPGTSIASYDWDFGDGISGSQVQAFHRFAAGGYVVTLTVTDTNGVSASARQSLTVGAGAVPKADFVSSPTSPLVNQDIVFNASTSTAGSGHTIVRYDWNMGSGIPRTGITVTKSYDVAGTFTVVLTVTDESGQTGTAMKNVVVSGPSGTAPVARFTVSPSPAAVSVAVTFDGSGSTATFPANIARYEWNFGDGSPIVSTTAPTATITHPYSAPTPPGPPAVPNVITLTVFDTLGNSGTTTHSLVVQ